MSDKNLKSKSSSTGSSGSEPEEEIDPSEKPDFIYGGPFIKTTKDAGFFMEAITPLNSKLEGSYKLSVAYRALKDRMPVILTKVIDRISKIGGPDASTVINEIAEMKNALITNKMYEPLKGQSEDAVKWNEWIQATPCYHYFNNSWLFTECYIYRRLYDILQNTANLGSEDPFFPQKQTAFKDMLEASCIAAEELSKMLKSGDGGKQQNQQNFSTLCKFCLWSNKCDLSLSAGSAVVIGDGVKEQGARAMDPVRWIEEFKANVIVDDSMKVPLEFKMGKPIDPNSEEPPAPAAGAEPEPPKKVPCPARVVDIQTFYVDIICDNAGYELVCDLILADFLVQKKIAHKVRFHVKSIPWFVSDVTPDDFTKTVKWCADANYSRTAPGELPPPPPPPKGAKPPKKPEPTTEPAELGPPPPPRDINSNALVEAAKRWQDYIKDGIFLLETHQFWTSPHPFIDMKVQAYDLYRRLQYSQLLVFKGDLNYRKLLADTRVNPTLGFEKALKGFNPAPMLAIRTVKSDLISGTPKGKADQLTLKDPTWMETGDYGTIQFCKKKEALKPSDRPCHDYGRTCYGVICPEHDDIY